MNIIELLNIRKNSNKVAIIDKDIHYTYRELVMCIENHLEKFALTNGKNVLLLMENSVEYVISYFCTLLKAQNLVLGTPKLTSIEIAELIKYCEIDVVICSKHSLCKIHEIATNFTVLCIEFDKNAIKLNLNCEYIFSNIDACLYNECMLVLGSSGTTVSGKRALFSQEKILQNATMHIESLELSSNDIFLVCLPMCFGYCHTCQFITSFILGATMVIGNSSFFVQEFWNTCKRYGVTSFLAVPTYIILLNKFSGNVDLEQICLKHICFGGAKISMNEFVKFREKYISIQLRETYGMTELGPRVTTMDANNIDEKAGSVGKVLTNVQIRIVDGDGNNLPYNKNGNIEVKSPTRLLQYYNNEELTKKSFRDDWFITGDVGYLDTDGYLFITGRYKNIIISGGINIYAEEYEALINQYPEIIESRVYGLEDELLGEKPAVMVKVTDNFNSLKFEEYCNKCFGKNKISEIHIEKDIPKTYTGKIKR